MGRREEGRKEGESEGGRDRWREEGRDGGQGAEREAREREREEGVVWKQTTSAVAGPPRSHSVIVTTAPSYRSAIPALVV